MTDKELMEQALEALEKHAMQRTYAGGVYIANVAIALRERLAQQEQGPVVWMNGWGDLFKNPDDAERGQTLTPLYTALPQRKPWVGLTDEEIKTLPQWFPSHESAAVMPLIRAIEAKLKEKNT